MAGRLRERDIKGPSPAFPAARQSRRHAPATVRAPAKPHQHAGPMPIRVSTRSLRPNPNSKTPLPRAHRAVPHRGRSIGDMACAVLASSTARASTTYHRPMWSRRFASTWSAVSLPTALRGSGVRIAHQLTCRQFGEENVSECRIAQYPMYAWHQRQL